MVLGLRGHLVAAGDFFDRQAVMRFVELVDQFVEQTLDVLEWLLNSVGDLLCRERLVRDVDDGFEDREHLGLGRFRVIGRLLDAHQQLIGG